MADIACYCRVSTESQEIERQLESTREYADREFHAELADLRIYRSIVDLERTASRVEDVYVGFGYFLDRLSEEGLEFVATGDRNIAELIACRGGYHRHQAVSRSKTRRSTW